MSDIDVKFTFEENDPIKATFKAYDNPPEVIVETKSYDELADKPSINDVELVGNKSLDELGIQPQGDYALTSDLTNYVKDTDYVTNSKAGIVTINEGYGTTVISTQGLIGASTRTLTAYNNTSNNLFIGKGTLENIKDDYVKRGITENQTELTEDEKSNAKNWLGYADQTDIMQAIASIPQFKLSIVNELPLTGEKMTLYFVPKEGADNDIYNEYVWIEQTGSYEFLGSTAIDLTDYVKNTDYPATDKAGVIKVSPTYGMTTYDGKLIGTRRSLDQYLSADELSFVSKYVLDNVLTQYAKTVSLTQAEYDALTTKDANTLYLIEEE